MIEFPFPPEVTGEVKKNKLLENLGEILTSAMLAISDNVYVMLFMANILMLFLGMFMEILPIMLILAPILFPLFTGMGVSDVHLGVVMVLNLMI